MRILFLSDNFPPEHNAPARRVYEHALHWHAAGHEVTVITCAPNFPGGRLHPGYRNRLYAVEHIGGIRVVRVKTYIAPNVGVLRRTVDFLSFMVAGFLAGLVQKRPDVVVGTSPQFFTAVAACALAAVRGRPFVMEVRDLWPEVIVQVGAMRPGWWLKALTRVELGLYRRAAAVVTVTRSQAERLRNRGVPGEKLTTVVQGVELDRFRPLPPDARLVRELDLGGRFVVGFIGTMGLTYRLGTVLDAAERLAPRADIAFLLVGDGARRDELERDALRRGLRNVRFVPPVPAAEVPQYWALCSAALVPLPKAEAFRTAGPAKIPEAIAMGLPIIVAGMGTESAQVVQRTGAGVTIPAEDAVALARTLESLAGDPRRLSAMAAASRAAAVQFSRAEQARWLATILDAIRQGRPVPDGPCPVHRVLPPTTGSRMAGETRPA